MKHTHLTNSVFFHEGNWAPYHVEITCCGHAASSGTESADEFSIQWSSGHGWWGGSLFWCFIFCRIELYFPITFWTDWNEENHVGGGVKIPTSSVVSHVYCSREKRFQRFTKARAATSFLYKPPERNYCRKTNGICLGAGKLIYTHMIS